MKTRVHLEPKGGSFKTFIDGPCFTGFPTIVIWNHSAKVPSIEFSFDSCSAYCDIFYLLFSLKIPYSGSRREALASLAAAAVAMMPLRLPVHLIFTNKRGIC